ncbi:MAG: NTP transferase domain-containing protein [Isosphaeraceae bacterium]
MIAAIVPAAGLSRRMGRPKLTLPVGGIPVIARVVSALRDGGASIVVVVAPPADAPGALDLIQAAEARGAVVVVPDLQPAEMRDSIELALNALEVDAERDADPRREAIVTVLLTPADSPGLQPSTVRQVLERARAEPDRIVVPIVEGRRGHPVALPWTLAREVRQLPAGVGVNALIAERAGRIVELPVDDPGVIADLDTPEDYARWSGRD